MTVDQLGSKTNRALRPVSPRFKTKGKYKPKPKVIHESLQDTGKLSDLINVDNQNESDIDSRLNSVENPYQPLNTQP